MSYERGRDSVGLAGMPTSSASDDIIWLSVVVHDVARRTSVYVASGRDDAEVEGRIARYGPSEIRQGAASEHVGAAAPKPVTT